MWDTKFSIPYGYKEDTYVANQARAMLNNATASLGSNIMVGDKMLPTGISRQDAKMGSLDVNLRSYHQLSTAAQEVIKRNIANQYGVAKEDLPPEMLNKGFMDVLRKLVGRDPSNPNFNPTKPAARGFGPEFQKEYFDHLRERHKGGVSKPEFSIPSVEDMAGTGSRAAYPDIERFNKLRNAFETLHGRYYKTLGDKGMGRVGIKVGIGGKQVREFEGPDRNLWGMAQALRHAQSEFNQPSRNILGKERLPRFLDTAEKMMQAALKDVVLMEGTHELMQGKKTSSPPKKVSTQTPAQAQAQKQTAQPAPSPAPSVIPTPKPKKKAKKTPAQTQEEAKAQTTVPEPAPQPAPAKVETQQASPAPKPKKGGSKKPKVSVNTPVTPPAEVKPTVQTSHDDEDFSSKELPPASAGFSGFKVKKAGS